MLAQRQEGRGVPFPFLAPRTYAAEGHGAWLDVLSMRR
jgi:hypothetical protein